MSRFRSGSAASVVIAIALGAIAFAAGSGTQIGRTAPAEVAVLLVAGAALALALLTDADDRPLYGSLAVGFFGLLVVLTGLSMTWSIAPDLTLQEMGRSLVYLAVFAVAVTGARQFPRAGPALLVAVLLTAVAVCAWAAATRVFPGALAEQIFVARLSAPFEYWNALGGLAAMGIPATLWLAARREGGTWPAALAYPALGLLVITILLTQSRGALVAGVIATAVWLSVVPLRLRTAPVLAAALIAAVPVSAWALSQDAFTVTFAPLSARKDIAGMFFVFLLVTLLVLGAVGWVIASRRDRVTLAPERRRRIGIGLVSLVGVVVVAGVVAAAVTGGGIGGRIDSLISEKPEVAAAGAQRLGSSSSSRGEYWRQAWDVFKEAPVTGRGADGFSIARFPYRTRPQAANHAHGFLIQTVADLGLLGLLVVLALLATWLVAIRRTLSIPLRRLAPGADWTPDRIALTALACSVLAYGLQSLIDWTWFVPGVTATAVAAAGFLAGRGPVRTDSPARRPIGSNSLRVAGALAIAVTALLCSWSVWQPERSSSSTNDALSLADRGDTQDALRKADHARDIDPYSTEPLYARAVVLTDAGRKIAAYRSLEQAVAEHPRDPETWTRLGTFELDELDLPLRALATTRAAASIDRFSPRVSGLLQRAQQAYTADQAALNPQPKP